MVGMGTLQTLCTLVGRVDVCAMARIVTLIVLGSLLLPSATALGAPSARRLEQQARKSLQLQADVVHGKALYQSNCSRCHGAEAEGDITRLVPALAGQRRAYLIKHLIALGDPDWQAAQMHPKLELTGLDTPQAWADVASFLRDSAPLQVVGSANREMAKRGARNYQRWCASCHESDASGDDAAFVPALRHQHHAYLLKELQMVSAQHRLDVSADVMRTLDSLDTAELAGIADHVAVLSAGGRKEATARD